MIKTELFSSANIERFNLYIEHITKYESVSKFQDIRVAYLWGKYHA